MKLNATLMLLKSQGCHIWESVEFHNHLVSFLITRGCIKFECWTFSSFCWHTFYQRSWWQLVGPCILWTHSTWSVCAASAGRCKLPSSRLDPAKYQVRCYNNTLVWFRSPTFVHLAFVGGLTIVRIANGTTITRSQFRKCSLRAVKMSIMILRNEKVK